jgi:HEAT repeat protein
MRERAAREFHSSYEERTREERQLLITTILDPVPSVRRATVRELSSIGDTSATLPLVAVMKDTDGCIRLEVVQVLGHLRDQRSLPELAATLRDADVETRSGAAWAIGRIGTDAATSLLLPMLGDSSWSVRWWAAEGLGELRDTGAVGQLIQTLGDTSGRVRTAAAWALGNIGSRDAVPPLVDRIRHPDSLVAFEAAVALGRIGNEGSESLAVVLRDPDVLRRRSAARGLAERPDSAAVVALIAAASRRDLPVVAEVFWFYLAALHPDTPVDHVGTRIGYRLDVTRQQQLYLQQNRSAVVRALAAAMEGGGSNDMWWALSHSGDSALRAATDRARKSHPYGIPWGRDAVAGAPYDWQLYEIPDRLRPAK